nr:MAG TPA: hypothetical protein [Caudoviricetes sp.]
MRAADIKARRASLLEQFQGLAAVRETLFL